MPSIAHALVSKPRQEANDGPRLGLADRKPLARRDRGWSRRQEVGLTIAWVLDRVTTSHQAPLVFPSGTMIQSTAPERIPASSNEIFGPFGPLSMTNLCVRGS